MLEDFYSLNPYELEKEKKDKMLTSELKELTKMHMEKCAEYKRMTEAMGYDEGKVKCKEDIPFFPVRMFKEIDLMSISRKDVFKVMTSSGTTGQSVSKIYLDKENAGIPQKVMVKILNDYIGKQRLPILIIDTPSVLKDRKSFSARGAAILGLRVLGREFVYALNDDMTLNEKVFNEFMDKHEGEKILIFGFTFMVWQHFYKNLVKMDRKYDLSKAWLMQSGGWKKLESEAISREKFKEKMKDVCGLSNFLDHYGMVEQTGCIYAECEYGHLHASIYSDIITRRYEDFSPCDIGEKGIIQVVSVLPRSYPGHSLLTEDEGIILGEDDCPCGRKGKYVKIIGRMKSAELRGCSDTYAAKFK